MSAPSPESARKTVRADRWTRGYILFLTIVVMASLLVLVFLAIQDHHRIKQNEAIQRFIRDQAVENGLTGRTIQDCTQPGGKCYERSQRQTADVVASINRVSIVAAACATRGDTQTAASVQRCVLHRLARDKR